LLDVQPGIRALRDGIPIVALAGSQSLEVTLPAMTGTLLCTIEKGATAAGNPRDALTITAGVRMGAVVEIAGDRNAVLVPFAASNDFSINIQVATGWQLTGVMAVMDDSRSLADRLGRLSSWNLVEDGPPGRSGKGTLGMEVSR